MRGSRRPEPGPGCDWSGDRTGARSGEGVSGTISYGWKYAFRDYSSDVFPTWDSAIQDLAARFPAAARFGEYLLLLARLDEASGGTTGLAADAERAAERV